MGDLTSSGMWGLASIALIAAISPGVRFDFARAAIAWLLIAEAEILPSEHI